MHEEGDPQPHLSSFDTRGASVTGCSESIGFSWQNPGKSGQMWVGQDTHVDGTQTAPAPPLRWAMPSGHVNNAGPPPFPPPCTMESSPECIWGAARLCAPKRTKNVNVVTRVGTYIPTVSLTLQPSVTLVILNA